MTPDGGGSERDPSPDPVDPATADQSAPAVDDPVVVDHGIAPEVALRGGAEDIETRVDELAERARAAREAFVPPGALEQPLDPDERALAYCRQGLWPVIAVYVDRRGAGARLGQPHHDRLETALNTWLELYAACYGVSIDPAFSVREAAELFVSTHNVRDVAQLLTDVPSR